jgi:hypothetical protein
MEYWSIGALEYCKKTSNLYPVLQPVPSKSRFKVTKQYTQKLIQIEYPHDRLPFWLIDP